MLWLHLCADLQWILCMKVIFWDNSRLYLQFKPHWFVLKRTNEPNWQNYGTVFCPIPYSKECGKLPVLGKFHLCVWIINFVFVPSFVFLAKSVIWTANFTAFFVQHNKFLKKSIALFWYIPETVQRRQQGHLSTPW